MTSAYSPSISFPSIMQRSFSLHREKPNTLPICSTIGNHKFHAKSHEKSKWSMVSSWLQQSMLFSLDCCNRFNFSSLFSSQTNLRVQLLEVLGPSTHLLHSYSHLLLGSCLNTYLQHSEKIHREDIFLIKHPCYFVLSGIYLCYIYINKNFHFIIKK